MPLISKCSVNLELFLFVQLLEIIGILPNPLGDFKHLWGKGDLWSRG